MGAFRGLVIGAALLAWALPALAHRLVVYATVEEGEIVVEATFSSGRIAVEGEVRVLDAENTLIATVPLGDSGMTRFAVPEGAEDGVTLEVSTDAGHEDYWVLTPVDLGVSE